MGLMKKAYRGKLKEDLVIHTLTFFKKYIYTGTTFLGEVRSRYIKFKRADKFHKAPENDSEVSQLSP